MEGMRRVCAGQGASGMARVASLWPPQEHWGWLHRQEEAPLSTPTGLHCPPLSTPTGLHCLPCACRSVFGLLPCLASLQEACCDGLLLAGPQRCLKGCDLPCQAAIKPSGHQAIRPSHAHPHWPKACTSLHTRTSASCQFLVACPPLSLFDAPLIVSLWLCSLCALRSHSLNGPPRSLQFLLVKTNIRLGKLA